MIKVMESCIKTKPGRITAPALVFASSAFDQLERLERRDPALDSLGDAYLA